MTSVLDSISAQPPNTSGNKGPNDDLLVIPVPAEVADMIKKEESKNVLQAQLAAFNRNNKKSTYVPNFVFEFELNTRIAESKVTDTSHNTIQERILGIPSISNVFLSGATVEKLIHCCPSKGGIAWNSLSSFGRRIDVFFAEVAPESDRKAWQAMDDFAALKHYLRQNNRTEAEVAAFRQSLADSVGKALQGNRSLIHALVTCCCVDENRGGRSKVLRVKGKDVKEESSGGSSSTSVIKGYSSAPNADVVENHLKQLLESVDTLCNGKAGDKDNLIALASAMEETFKVISKVTRDWGGIPLLELTTELKQIIGNRRYKEEYLYNSALCVTMSCEYTVEFEKLVTRVGSLLVEYREDVVVSSKILSKKRKPK